MNNSTDQCLTKEFLLSSMCKIAMQKFVSWLHWITLFYFMVSFKTYLNFKYYLSYVLCSMHKLATCRFLFLILKFVFFCCWIRNLYLLLRFKHHQQQILCDTQKVLFCDFCATMIDLSLWTVLVYVCVYVCAKNTPITINVYSVRADFIGFFLCRCVCFGIYAWSCV